MQSPWLDIPLADYEGHMALPEVGQAQLLADVFEAAMQQHQPRSVAVLGCAGGNGFERIASSVTERVVGIDLNAAYVDEARRRFGRRLPSLELHVGDLEQTEFDFAPVALVFAGLVFEYVDVAIVLQRVRAMLVEGGVLVCVFQLPSSSLSDVTPSRFGSLARLASAMQLVVPEQFRHLASAQGYVSLDERGLAVPGGRNFRVHTLRR